MQVTDEMVRVGAFALCKSMGIDPERPFRDRHGREMNFPEWHRWQADVRASLSAALAAMWRPANEHDGSMTPVIVWTGEPGWPCGVARWRADCVVKFWEGLDGESYEATHFMPLPSPPKAEG